MKLTERLQHAWNAFRSQDSNLGFGETGSGNSRPGHRKSHRINGSSFSSAIFNRIAMDAAMTEIHHVKIDTDTEDRETVKSGLHYCLNTEANIDQSHIQFLQDVVFSMFDEGSVAVVPVDTSVSPKVSGGYDIKSLRVGKVTQWYSTKVEVELYNEKTSNLEKITLPKHFVAIIENPMYAVMNDSNATLKRLIKKMDQLDNIDEILASGKLNMLIQLPYAVKNDIMKKRAEERVKNLESQLSNTSNKHGIGYVDATEKIHQFSRPLDNKIIEDIEFLTVQFYNQLGLTQNIFNGTASEVEMRAYYTRTVDPVIQSIITEFNRKFLSKTARTQGQALESYRDPFKLVTIEQVVQLADTVRRNGILTSNEVRRLIGFKTHNDPEADKLTNPNIADKNQDKAKTGSLTSPEKAPPANPNE